MSWLTFVLLALVLIFAVQGFRKGMLRMAISMVFFLMVLGVTSWLNPYISDFVREKTTWQISIEEKCNEVLLEQLEGRDDLQSITGQVFPCLRRVSSRVDAKPKFPCMNSS